MPNYSSNRKNNQTINLNTDQINEIELKRKSKFGTNSSIEFKSRNHQQIRGPFFSEKGNLSYSPTTLNSKIPIPSKAYNAY